MNEVEMIIKIQEGDKSAFEDLFHLYKNKALRTAFHITKNQASAEDVVQEAFVRCYLEIDKLKKPEAFSSWFYRILVREAWRHDAASKKAMPVENIFDNISETSPSVEQEYLQEEMADDLYQHIQNLEENQRLCVILFYYNDLTTKEIAGVLGCMEGTVKSRLYLARKKLKNKLEKQSIKEAHCYETR